MFELRARSDGTQLWESQLLLDTRNVRFPALHICQRDKNPHITGGEGKGEENKQHITKHSLLITCNFGLLHCCQYHENMAKFRPPSSNIQRQGFTISFVPSTFQVHLIPVPKKKTKPHRRLDFTGKELGQQQQFTSRGSWDSVLFSWDLPYFSSCSDITQASDQLPLNSSLKSTW